MATYVNDLRLKEIATGDESGTWGTSTNTNLELIAEAFSFGTEAITTNADTHTTTIADGSTDPGRSIYLKYTGTLDSACTITIGPNTVSKLWFIENGTSGSQNIIISQGSGASITIPPGDTKAIYSDGAGSGAAMVDAFASLNVVDLKVEDDLTVTDDLIVNGDIDLEGSIDVNGTANLDVVDIDGAVDMASTLAVTGIVTLTDDLIIGDGKTIGSASDVDAMTIASNGQVTFSQTLIGTALDISGDIDVDGTTNLDVVDIDGAVDMASTLAVGGAVTANAGVVIDNITIDGTEIDLSSGDLTLDSAGDIILDADGADILLKDAGTTFGELTNSSTDFVIKSTTSDKDILFKGNDGGSAITALTLDMSDAGTALFNNKVAIGETSPDNQLHVTAGSNVIAKFEASHTDGNARILFKPKDNNGWNIGANDSGSFTIFDVVASTNSFVVETGAAANTLVIDSNSRVGIGTDSPATDLTISSATPTITFTDTDNNYDATIAGLSGSLVLTADANAEVGTETIQFHTGGSQKATLDASGKFSLGTTAPDGLLGVQSATGEVGFNAGTSSSPERGNIYFDTDGSGWCLSIGKYQSSSFSSLMKIKDTGQVSIGSGNTFEGGLLCLDTSGNNNRSIVIGRSATDDASKSSALSILHYNNGSEEPVCLVGAGIDDDTNNTVRIGGGFSNLNSATVIDFFTAANNDTTTGTRAARFDSSQNFLVGNTSTNLSSSAFGTVLFSSGRTVHSRNVDGGTSAMQIFGNAGECRIMGDGDILNTNNSYGAISDIRLKENIVDTDKKLSILNKVRVVDFNFIEKADTQTGVIAQELEELLPDLVNTGEDGYKTVKYSRFVPMLIKAVQEQQEQIESLTSEIANLKGG